MLRYFLVFARKAGFVYFAPFFTFEAYHVFSHISSTAINIALASSQQNSSLIFIRDLTINIVFFDNQGDIRRCF